METEKLATAFPALRRSRDHGSGTDWRLTSPACGLLAGCLRIARCRTGSAGPPSSAWPRTVTVPVISYDVCAATAASNGKKKDQRIEAGSRLGWQRMQRAGPTRPIYSAIVEPFWPLLAWRTLARPHGYPPATRLQLGHSASGAHLEQLWGNSGAVLEHPGAERDGEGWRWRGMHRGGGAGWGIVEGGHRVSPGPARDAGWWPAGLGAHRGGLRCLSSPARCSEPPGTGVVPQLLGGILQGPIPAGTQLAHGLHRPRANAANEPVFRPMQTSVAARQRRNTSQHFLRQAGGNWPLPASARPVSGQLH